MLESAFPVLLQRGIKRGFLTLFRERQWATALGALFGVFLLLQLLLIVLMGLEGIQTLLRERTDLRLEIREEASDANIQNFYSALQTQPYIDETVYITKEQAYERTRVSDPELIAFLEEFLLQNPYSDTIGVTLHSLNDYEQFAAFIEEQRWQSVIDPTFLSEITNQEEHIYELLSLTNAGRMLTILVVGLTGISLIFITTELVRRRALARSDEVLVERLAGASPLAILIPFVTEAVILFTIAIIFSTAFLLFLLLMLPVFIPALSANGALGPLHAEISSLLRTLLPLLLVGELLITPLIAAMGAWLGIRPQIHSPRITLAT